MIGRQLIDAMRQPEFLPGGPPLQEPPATSPLPPGVLGYAVARCGAGGRIVLSHTDVMPLDQARRETDAQRQADQSGYSWAVVEIRRLPVPP